MILNLFPSFKNIEQINTPLGRLYKKEDTYYASVTTMLSYTSDKTGLIKWRKRVGEEEANKISKAATTKGTSIHSLVESACLGKNLTFNSEEEQQRFIPLWNFVSSDIDTLVGLELPLFSNTLQLSGTCDLAYIDTQGQAVLGDIKTSRKPKRKEWIEDYYIQVTAYSLMIHEMYGFTPTIGKIIISIENTTVQTVLFQIENYFSRFQERLMQFRSLEKTKLLFKRETLKDAFV